MTMGASAFVSPEIVWCIGHARGIGSFMIGEIGLDAQSSYASSPKPQIMAGSAQIMAGSAVIMAGSAVILASRR
jgi:hypothetical protein